MDAFILKFFGHFRISVPPLILARLGSNNSVANPSSTSVTGHENFIVMMLAKYIDPATDWREGKFILSGILYGVLEPYYVTWFPS